MRRSLFGALSAAGGIGALLLGLVAIDGRVRDQIAQVLRGRVGDLAAIALQAVQDQSIEHAPLVIFALAAMVLVMFMLRT